MLTQPFHGALEGARHVLLAGCGGGYDILGAVPLAVELWARGLEVSLASLSFCYLNGLEGADQDARQPNLYRVPAEAATTASYCPEAWLARWLGERLDRAQPIWAFDKTGVRPLRAAYGQLVGELAVDTVVLVDGGIDSLLRGDESELGTPAEDLASLCALAGLPGPRLLLACLGMGVELRDGICHAQALARVAELTREGAFLGTASLLSGTQPGELYLDAVSYVFEHQPGLRQSHVHRTVSAAVRGEFGSPGPHIWISPLLAIAWFFEGRAVAAGNLLLPALEGTESIWEVSAAIEGARRSLSIQDRCTVPW